MENGEMQERIELLVQQVNLLRKQRADLSRRLTQIQEQQSATLEGQFPLSELSRMTDGIVHDMRNGMGIIRNIVGFMRDDPAATPHMNDLLKISRSLDFCEVVLRNLAAMGGQDILDPEEVNLEKIAREMYSMLEHKLVDVELVIEGGEKEPVILADAGHMKQVFMNLIKNAGEAMPDGGTLTCRFHREANAMHIEIQDSGEGITEENQKHLFEKFFTTKERGYGLGLHIVRTIVERHGGTISVQSTVGKGTTFNMLMPIEAE
jgi:signal transduction histidine kinase